MRHQKGPNGNIREKQDLLKWPNGRSERQPTIKCKNSERFASAITYSKSAREARKRCAPLVVNIRPEYFDSHLFRQRLDNSCPLSVHCSLKVKEMKRGKHKVFPQE